MAAQERSPAGQPPFASIRFKRMAGSARNPICPKCQGRMAVSRVTPVLFASGLDDVIFRCGRCAAEVKRTVKRA